MSEKTEVKVASLREDTDKLKGLYCKFLVHRADDSPKHEKCEYFVLDWDHDPHALPAIAAYIESCQAEHPQLAADLQKRLDYYKSLKESA